MTERRQLNHRSTNYTPVRVLKNLFISIALLWAYDSHSALAVPAFQITTESAASNGAEIIASSKEIAGPEVARAERGITGTHTFEHADPTLRVRVQRDMDAPLIVRLRKLEQTNNYELRFIGTVEGKFDLRDSLENGKGQSIADLPPMMVSIISTLPNDQRSDLFEATNFQPKIMGGYRLTLLMAGVVWLLVPLIVYAIKTIGRPTEIALPIAPPPPSLAEQLEPLVMAAASRGLSTHEKGRLELLLVHYWRERSVLSELNMAAAIQQLRLHPEAGPLLNAVEAWLHRSPASASDEAGEEAGDSPEEILHLLLPYRPATICAEGLQASGGSQ